MRSATLKICNELLVDCISFDSLVVRALDSCLYTKESLLIRVPSLYVGSRFTQFHSIPVSIEHTTLLVQIHDQYNKISYLV
jgi:hypothetical protein